MNRDRAWSLPERRTPGGTDGERVQRVTRRVVVLGAGFGGLELATEVSGRCGTGVQLTLIDQAEGFVFGFSKLDVMFGRRQPDQVLHRYASMMSPGVRFVNATVTSMDP